MRPEAGRMPSMEWEPKTLSLEQLKFAREAALDVLSTHSSEEAVRIFTEGLKPVLGIRKNFMDSDDDDDDGDLFDPDEFVDETPNSIHHHYGRAAKKRDVVTAPF